MMLLLGKQQPLLLSVAFHDAPDPSRNLLTQWTCHRSPQMKRGRISGRSELGEGGGNLKLKENRAAGRRFGLNKQVYNPQKEKDGDGSTEE